MSIQSNHFDGKKFHNFPQTFRKKLQILKWLLFHKPAPWPSSINIHPQKVEPKRLELGELGVTYINHSTCLIQLDEWNILTDPIWSKRASPLSWIGPKRVCPPGVNFEDLPPIDYVCLSHNHYDHMDKATLRALYKQHSPTFITGIGNKRYLTSFGLTNIWELDWWESFALGDTHMLSFVPAQHFSARGLWDSDKALWGGFMLQGPTSSVYFAGDTGYGPHLKQIKERLGSPNLALLPIGAFKPEEIMHAMHMSPHDAVQALIDLDASYALAIHYGTFQLTDEKYEEPIEKLNESLQAHGLSEEKFWQLKPGENRKIRTLS
jgi:L-ascorbate metabolism protein UlaG (beta-lactamase superfamily)